MTGDAVESPASSWRWAAAEIISVGLPFCAFKIVTGIIALHRPSLVILGYVLLALGAIDLALNVANLASLLLLRRRIAPVCLSQWLVVGVFASKREVGVAIDVLISFILVAIVVGFGLFGGLSTWTLRCWNLAVVLNVLGAGIGQLLTALRR